MNNQITFIRTTDRSPDHLLNQSKVRDFLASASYLEGEETVTEAWSAPGSFFSTNGIKIR